MTIEHERYVTLRAAYQEMRRHREAVTEWMNEEAEHMRVRRNGEAPGWAAYEAALGKFDRLLEELLGGSDVETSAP